MSLENHPKIIAMANVFQAMEEYLLCPICKDRYSHPVRMKCAHTFCQLCAERHIRLTPKARCPICNIPGVTKRSLVPDNDKIELINEVKELVKVVEDTFGVDFGSVIIPHKATREAPGDTPFVSKTKLANQSAGRSGPTGDKVPQNICRNIVTNGFQKEKKTALKAPRPAANTSQRRVQEKPKSTTTEVFNKPRTFSFKLLGSLRSEGKGHENEPNLGNGRVEKTIPFVKLGRLVPYNERKMLSAEIVPSFTDILDRKRRRSSDHDQSTRNVECESLSKTPRLESDLGSKLQPNTANQKPEVQEKNDTDEFYSANSHFSKTTTSENQEMNEKQENDGEVQEKTADQQRIEAEENVEQVDRFDSLIPNTDNFINPIRRENPSTSQMTTRSNVSVDLFNDLDEDNRMIAGRGSPSPTTINFSQSQDKEEASNNDKETLSEDLFPKVNNLLDGCESDDDIFLSTPQKTTTRKFCLSSTKTSGIAEEKNPQGRFRFSSAKSKESLESEPVIEEEEKRKMVLVCSGLKQDDRDLYDDLIDKFNLKQKFSMDSQVSHLIANVDSSNCADRTLKFLQAINQRNWIVNTSWIKECLRLDKLIKPDKYEVLDTNGRDGPHKARMSGRETRLFSGYEICLYGTFATIQKSELTQMLQKEGASAVRSIHSMSFSKKGLLIMDQDISKKDKEAERYFKAYKLPTVSAHWALDSISGFSILPVKKYLLHEAQEDEIEKLGYV